MSDNPWVNNLLKSFQEEGLINHSEGDTVPSRSHIQQLIQELRHVLFPGYFEPQGICTESLSNIIENRLNAVSDKLTDAIFKTLQWSNKEACKSEEHQSCLQKAKSITEAFLHYLPALRASLKKDVEATFAGDPAAKSETEIVLAYPGFQATTVHRIAHFLYQHQVPLIPRLMTEIAHSETGIDIHPGARIGDYFCIDHGTGTVIGETAVIGHHVKIYQGVTLGALSVPQKYVEGKRHPTLENYVTVYSGTTILGGETTIGEHSVIGGNVWITQSVAPCSKVYLTQDIQQVVKTKDL